VRYVRHWLWADEIHTDTGRQLFAHHYYGAFDTTGHCQWCGAELLLMLEPYDKMDPRGRPHRHRRCVGYVCHRCQVAAPDDLRGADWRPLEECVEALAIAADDRWKGLAP
jgi:hypothetical protein